MRFSVIMPVCLEPYEWGEIKSASSPEDKFIRAVLSFIHQSMSGNELIIIADGSDKAETIYKENFSSHPHIRFKRIEKQPLFSGKVRQSGIDMARGEIICYLDHDDFIGSDHLKIINDHFTGQWVYFNDWLAQDKIGSELVFTGREVLPQLNYIGTSMIAHKRSLEVKWDDGYTHDWRMIEKYLLPHPGIRIPRPQYYVCHFHEIDY